MGTSRLLHDAIFFFCSSAAQVWSALMVFHILLIRDLKHQVEHEIDALWLDAKIWWPKLLVSLKDSTERGFRTRLQNFGLDYETILRADTHKNSFIRLIAAIKGHKLAHMHPEETVEINEQTLSLSDWQLKFEPIAERITELELEKPETSTAFYLGITGVAVNLSAIAAIGIWANESTVLLRLLISILLVSNLILIGLFGMKVRQALKHFNITSQHELITPVLRDTRRKRGSKKRRSDDEKPLSMVS